MSAIVSLEINIRAASIGDAVLISELALRSKAYWGYPDDFIERCRDELTYSESQIKSSDFGFWVCEAAARIAGFYGLEFLAPGEAELEALFVEPDMIGKGIGRALIEHAKALAAAHGVSKITIQGDPNAEAFYLAAGGVADGQTESLSIPGRFLPVFTITLKRAEVCE